MPITLGCPSCMKRFRAKDESAGKRVKCPYCGAAVPVPSAEESASAAAPTMAIPPPPPPAPRPRFEETGTPPLPKARPASSAPPPEPAPVATPDDWGAGEQPPAPMVAAAPVPPPLDFPKAGKPSAPAPKRGARPEPARPGNSGPKTPDQMAAPYWRKTKAGLGWVLFGLFFLALPGFVGFGKLVYVRATGNELPKGEGWVSIPGVVNSEEAGAVRMSKMEQLDFAAYAIPVVLGGLFVSVGRLTCGAAPRSSGAKGLFVFSGLFSLVALAALVTTAATGERFLLMQDIYKYASIAFLLTAPAAEFWFLTGLAASGLALKRPKAARAVGAVGFVYLLIAAAATVGWTLYSQDVRPKRPGDDWLLYEQAGVMLGWLLLIGTYWRAVRSVRVAVREFLENAGAA